MEVTTDRRPVAGGIQDFIPPLPGTYSGTRGYNPFPGSVQPRSRGVFVFLSDALPRTIYLYLLLTLPLLYVSRVNEIFEYVEQSRREIQEKVQGPRMARAVPVGKSRAAYDPPIPSYVPITIKPWASDSEAIDRLLKSWEYFVGSLVGEWETLNIVSVLLAAAILTTLQVDGAVTDPYTRYSALLALICSLMSLLYGCIYIIRFNTMHRTRKIVEWAERAQKTTTFIWWNVWTLLAMPVIWFSWSFILYLICLMTFVWRTGTTSDTVLQITPLAALGPRIAFTLVLVLGLVYLYLIILEFRQYGNAMDKKWRSTLDDWKNEPQVVLVPPGEQRVPPMVYPSVSIDEEGNGPPILPNQETSWSDGPLNRQRHRLRRPAEYNSNNLVERPTEWRSDYGVWRIQKPRTSVDEFTDPIKRKLCKILSFIPSDLCVRYDLRFFPDPQNLSFPILGRNYNHIDFVQLATNPPVDKMRLFHPLLPWYIDVRKTQANGITVKDVFMQVFSELQLPIQAIDFHDKLLGSGIREKITRAFERRTQGSVEEKREGIKRVDYLEDEVVFVGLVRVQNGMWEMKTVMSREHIDRPLGYM